ncbi:MAG TPA: hypothetical protein VNJ03_10170 [Vicinamibacterales bacterium]|nr:hypothetical protein [Vicinamibacterales bacterium]
MGNATGIELGPDSCVLVAARAGATGAEVSAVHVIEPADFPAAGVALTEALRGARHQKKFPRRARVVLWSLEQPASMQDAAVRSATRPLLAAGFRVEAVLSPTQALAAVASARGRRTDGATAWLSINTHGAAIVIVRGSDTLFARTLSWTYCTGSISVREQLLQRYTFVSHIAPELKAGMAMVRARDGVVVDTVVTCGDLPDLRSLTMPLIEELDLEVETLDSSAGLHAVGSASEDRFAEWAPTIRLACAAALLPVRRASTRRPLAVAATVMIGIVGLAGYATGSRSTVYPVDLRIDTLPAVARDMPAGVPDTPAPTSSLPPPKVESRALPPLPTPPPVVQEPVATAPAVIQEPALQAPPTKQRPIRPRSRPAPAALKAQAPLLHPVPRVTSILIGSGRRLAMMDGGIVSVGDAVGPRVVLRIDSEAVILQDPSGAEVRVVLRPAVADGVESTPFAAGGRPHASVDGDWRREG